MKVIALVPGDDGAPAAFNRTRMDELDVNSMELSNALAAALGPVSMMLEEGCGVAVVDLGDGNVTITGVQIEFGDVL